LINGGHGSNRKNTIFGDHNNNMQEERREMITTSKKKLWRLIWSIEGGKKKLEGRKKKTYASIQKKNVLKMGKMR